MVGRLAELRFLDLNTGIVLSTVPVPYGANLYAKSGDTVDYTEQESGFGGFGNMPGGFGNMPGGNGQMPSFGGGEMPDMGGSMPDFGGGNMPDFGGGTMPDFGGRR